MSNTPGGWKSINYSLRVAASVGTVNFFRAVTSKNTCKVCAYGMGGQRGGMANEAGERFEICKKSIQAQLTDIQPEIPSTLLKTKSIHELRDLRSRDLERLGRLNQPLYKAASDNYFSPMDWERALEKIVTRFESTDPTRTFFYASGRSSNEAAFILHLFARLYGTNNVNNCSYYCHQASGTAMQPMLGTATATVQLEDLRNSDLIFVIGANPSSNHPRFLSELMKCRRRKGAVIVINPVKEPGLVRFAVPGSARSMVSGGSAIASLYLQPEIGGDIALMKGIAKAVLMQKGENTAFINRHTKNFEPYRDDIRNTSWDQIETACGVRRALIEDAAERYCRSDRVVFAWAMGITHHTHGVENVESIVNLALLRGMIGKQYAGLLPLRGHSNVQGVGSMGVTPRLKEKVFQNIEKKLGVKLPVSPGWDTISCIHAAREGKVDIAFMLGGNLYGSNPDTDYAAQALDKIPLRVFVSTTMNRGHLAGTQGETIILPAAVRDEEQQPTTQESMFNYVRMSDGGRSRLSNARSEVEIITEIAIGVLKEKKISFRAFKKHQHIRQAIAESIPGFEKMAMLDTSKEEFAIGGRTLHQPAFGTKDGNAVFRVVPLPQVTETVSSEGWFRLMSVRSEGQFNTIVYEESDAWRDQNDRWIILMNPDDISKLGLKKDDRVDIASTTGSMTNVRLRPFDIHAGNVLGYYPETNVLISTDVDPRSLTPSFKNTRVKITPSSAG
jgi:molybdopterin-dependent oxidoreductase alpha subunit